MHLRKVITTSVLMIALLIMLVPALSIGDSGTRAAPDILGYWSFDNLDGTLIPDDGGENLDGKNHGGEVVDGIRGKALLFNGGSTYASFPAMNIEDTSFTLEAWINPDPDTKQQYYTIFDDGTFYSDHRHRLLLGGPNWHSGELLVQFDGDFFSSGVCNWSQWNQVVYVFDQASKEERLYINGDLMGVHKVYGDHCYFDQPFYMGAMNGEDFYYFAGKIDEVYIYGSALKESQINANYKAMLEPNSNDEKKDASGFIAVVPILSLAGIALAMDRYRRKRV